MSGWCFSPKTTFNYGATCQRRGDNYAATANNEFGASPIYLGGPGEESRQAQQDDPGETNGRSNRGRNIGAREHRPPAEPGWQSSALAPSENPVNPAQISWPVPAWPVAGYILAPAVVDVAEGGGGRSTPHRSSRLGLPSSVLGRRPVRSCPDPRQRLIFLGLVHAAAVSALEPAHYRATKALASVAKGVETEWFLAPLFTEGDRPAANGWLYKDAAGRDRRGGRPYTDAGREAPLCRVERLYRTPVRLCTGAALRSICSREISCSLQS
jgi:hypothetical protein